MHQAQWDVDELIKKAKILDKMGLEGPAGDLAKQLRKGLEDLEEEIENLVRELEDNSTK
jgi:hypothetical protein